MSRAVICLGYAARGAAIAIIGGAAIVAVMLGFIWLSDASARWLGLADKFGVLFFLGYMAGAFGAIIGAAHCPTSTVPPPQSRTPEK